VRNGNTRGIRAYINSGKTEEHGPLEKKVDPRWEQETFLPIGKKKAAEDQPWGVDQATQVSENGFPEENMKRREREKTKYKN